MASAAARKTVINLRTDETRRALIDRAAAAVGKDRTEFMLEAATRQAEAVLLDQRYFQVDAEDFEKFVALLEAPPVDNSRLRKLLARKAPWED